MFDLFEWDDSDQDEKFFDDEYDDWWQQDERDLHSSDYDEDENEDEDEDDEETIHSLYDDASLPLFEDLFDGEWSLED